LEQQQQQHQEQQQNQLWHNTEVMRAIQGGHGPIRAAPQWQGKGGGGQDWEGKGGGGQGKGGGDQGWDANAWRHEGKGGGQQANQGQSSNREEEEKDVAHGGQQVSRFRPRDMHDKYRAWCYLCHMKTYMGWHKCTNQKCSMNTDEPPPTNMAYAEEVAKVMVKLIKTRMKLQAKMKELEKEKEKDHDEGQKEEEADDGFEDEGDDEESRVRREQRQAADCRDRRAKLIQHVDEDTTGREDAPTM